MASEAAIDDAGPLGERRCAGCLYDRRGLPPDAPCPECGYALPAGVAVLHLSRPRETTWGVTVVIVFAAIVFVLLARDPLGSISSGGYSVGLMVCAVVAAGLRWWRALLSDDAYVAQIWLAPSGLALVPDADRFAPGHATERIAKPLLAHGPLAFIFLPFLALARHGWFAWMLLLLIAAIVAMIVFSTRRTWVAAEAPPIDAVAPRLTRWTSIKKLTLKQTNRHAITVTFWLGGFLNAWTQVQFAGGPDQLRSVEAAIARYRVPTEARRR